MEKKSKLITASAYAKSRGLNRSTISREIASGKIPTVNGLYDPELADPGSPREPSPARA